MRILIHNCFRALLTVFLLSLLGLLASCGGNSGGGQSSLSPRLFLSDVFFPVTLTFAPDGRLFFTELSGDVKIAENGIINPEPFVSFEIQPGAREGVTGLALDPQFEINRFVYLFVTSGVPLRSRVIRFVESDGIATDTSVLIDELPAGNHNGGPLLFGSDGMLYVSVGDANDPDSAGDLGALSGKILRIAPDGSIPSDNPIAGSPVFASGFRNVFGMALDGDTGLIYLSENGPECDDELNVLLPGGNYGWRSDQPCGDSDPSFIQPIFRQNPSVSPTGLHVYEGGSLGLARGALLWGEYVTGQIKSFSVEGGSAQEESTLLNESLGEILDITQDRDGRLFFSTVSGIYELSTVDVRGS